MWQDCGLYWAWRGKGLGSAQAPTQKRIDYASVSAGQVSWKVAAVVYDDGSPTEVNTQELEGLRRSGASVVMPH